MVRTFIHNHASFLPPNIIEPLAGHIRHTYWVGVERLAGEFIATVGRCTYAGMLYPQLRGMRSYFRHLQTVSSRPESGAVLDTETLPFDSCLPQIAHQHGPRLRTECERPISRLKTGHEVTRQLLQSSLFSSVDGCLDH